MSETFFMIDFENVQPQALERLQPGASKIKVFLGQHQSKLLLSLVQALQPFGRDAQYIQIQGTGPDAVDFHIAFYIGLLASAHPDATFNIISKDKGFDPLVKHLVGLGITCHRLAEIPVPPHVPPAPKAPPSNQPRVLPVRKLPPPVKKTVVAPAKKSPPPKKAPAPAKKVTSPTTTPARAKVAIENLKKSTRPNKLKGLRSMLQSWFKPPLDENATDLVIQSLKDSKNLLIDGTAVRYTLD